MAANIQAYLENLRQPWGQIYYDILFEQLQDIKGKRVLDFGSGFGLVANHLAQDNQVLAVEPNEEMVALRAQDHPYQQLVGSLDQIESFEDASFDVILCHNVLEYVEDRKVVLKEFIRLLKPGGLLSIVKHNEVGRVLQTVVFENDTQKALDLLAGQDLETHSMGLAQAYDLGAAVEDLALEVQGLPRDPCLLCLAGQSLQGPRRLARVYAQDGAGSLPRVPLPGYRLLPAL